MVEILPDARATELLEPVRPVLASSLALLPDAPPLRIRTGDPDGFYALDGDVLVLSEALVGAELHHPRELPGPVPPLDRWRRAAASVLEGASLRELSRRTEAPPGSDWRWIGAAIYAADAVAPVLQLAAPDLALAVTTGAPGTHPRAGYAAYRAWAVAGTDPIRQARYLIGGGVVSADEWLKLGQWVLSASGGLAELPVRVQRVAAVDIPAELPAFSWRPLRVPAHRRGGFVRVEGDGRVEEPWAQADTELRTLAAAASTPCALSPDPGGPVGDWDVASAQGFGQVMGARGIRFSFRADGRLELVLADAFVGPLAAVAMAEQIGTSGLCAGRWRVAGASRLRLAELDTASLSMHGRSRDRFVMPAGGFGLAEWIAAMQQESWSWRLIPPERMVLWGSMMGGEVEVRLKRA